MEATKTLKLRIKDKHAALDREEVERAMDAARLQGRLEAFAMAMTECGKPTRHGGGGGRDCREIRTAIDILHLDTLRQMQAANAPSPGTPRLNDDPLTNE